MLVYSYRRLTVLVNTILVNFRLHIFFYQVLRRVDKNRTKTFGGSCAVDSYLGVNYTISVRN